MYSALKGTDPVIFFESQRIYDEPEHFVKGGVPTGEYEVPIGEPDVKKAGSHPLMTMVMLPWVAQSAENGSNGHWSFSVAKYGAQCSVDPFNTDAGNGLKTDCSTTLTANPNDANVPLLAVGCTEPLAIGQKRKAVGLGEVLGEESHVAFLTRAVISSARRRKAANLSRRTGRLYNLHTFAWHSISNSRRTCAAEGF